MKESTWIISDWKVRSRRSLGVPVLFPWVRNILQSQEVFLMDAKSNFFNFEDREECYTSNCMYFERQIDWCTQITYGHHPPCIRKAISGTFLSRSTCVNFWATEKCDISICMYSVRQIQRCDQNHLWTSSLGQRISSMHQEGYIRNFPDKLLSWHIYKCCMSNCMYF